VHNISTDLKNEIINGKRAVLVKITRKDGQIYGYTDHDLPLTVDSQLYVPAPGIKRTSLTTTTDDRVSNQEFASAWVDAPEEDLLAGLFDDAVVETMLCSWDHPEYGTFTVDKGSLGVIQWTADGFRGDVQSHMRQLTRNIAFTYTASCRHQLFSTFGPHKLGACTINKASYTFPGAVSVVSTDKLIFEVSGLTQADGFCSAGTITWSTGANVGVVSPVKKHTVGAVTTIELFLPTPYSIEVGDNFDITAGCDKTFATCKNKFNNVVNFGGFPHIQVEITTR